MNTQAMSESSHVECQCLEMEGSLFSDCEEQQ